MNSAVQNGGAREDFTKLGSGGVVRQQAVDVAPLRRVNQVSNQLSYLGYPPNGQRSQRANHQDHQNHFRMFS